MLQGVAAADISGYGDQSYATAGNPMQIVGILLEALDHHMCERLDSIEAQIAGVGVRLDQSLGGVNKGRRPSLNAITPEMVIPVVQSKMSEPDELRMYPGPDGKLAYIESGGLEQKEKEKEAKKGEEGEKGEKELSEKQPSRNAPEKETKRGAPSKDASNAAHKKTMVDALHNASGHNAKHAHTEWHQENRWADMTNSHLFHLLSVSSILINGFLTGLEADFSLRYLLGHTRFKEGTLAYDVQDIEYMYFRVADYIVLAWWILELLFYLLAQKGSFFKPANPAFFWNVFDVVCISFTLLELVADLVGSVIPDVFSQGYLRLLRICRVIRVLRLAKVVRFLQGVRKLIIAVQGALLTLVWALVLLALFLYVYALMMSTVIMQYYSNLETNTATLTDAERLRTEEMDMYYGGVIVTMSTLFEAITGGDWIVTSAPLYQISWAGRILWFSYIAFVIFGLLNVFTGIFVEQATKAANSDREIVMQAEKEDEKSYINQIRLLFETSGVDDGHITEEVLQELLLVEEFKVQLNALGLHTTEADGLFKLLDGDNSGYVSVDEFISGCLRLKGGAQAVDMVTMLYETNKLSKKLSRLETALDRALGLHIADEDAAEDTAGDKATSEKGSA